jgi:hypothetical protein
MARPRRVQQKVTKEMLDTLTLRIHDQLYDPLRHTDMRLTALLKDMPRDIENTYVYDDAQKVLVLARLLKDAVADLTKSPATMRASSDA